MNARLPYLKVIVARTFSRTSTTQKDLLVRLSTILDAEEMEIASRQWDNASVSVANTRESVS